MEWRSEPTACEYPETLTGGGVIIWELDRAPEALGATCEKTGTAAARINDRRRRSFISGFQGTIIVSLGKSAMFCSRWLPRITLL